MKGKRSSMPFLSPWCGGNLQIISMIATSVLRTQKDIQRNSIRISSLYSHLFFMKEDLPIPTPTLDYKDNNILEMSDISDTSDENGDISEKTSDPTFKLETSSEPHFIRQNELNGLVRELCLSKQQAELLGSRLQE
ncbi:hypothetical protein AVEN_150325-1 [Araneus ventricosus]|uniref:Uncharacterized protein n=1 Tax=Araneus ventricosus TaxID=182803 RepID=A0A4Y2RKY6_ARAVE|nr:hypothetical protein AVEN_175225-1 [Araneus ventricosus]GBN76438.1 hypothetical protein AVEN_150325-1 [Araneus ventricosus]